jgi:hypothetical protein
LEDFFHSTESDDQIPVGTDLGRTTRLPMPRPLDSSKEVLMFLGAGASVPAGIPGVEQMVDRLLTHLSHENDREYLQILTELVQLLRHWVNTNSEDKMVDIELILEVVERLENRSDVLPLFYENKKDIVEKIRQVGLSSKKGLLSDILKRFIKSETGKVDILVDYLNGLLLLMRHHKPLNIFSTNYDVCIERFCSLSNRKYFDGFEEDWNPSRFRSQDQTKDIMLYKLHGSVTWSRNEKGKCTRNEIAVTNTDDQQINIVTGEEEVPLILYPGKKLEYSEPVFDLFIELKSQINIVRYVIVVGYSFRDDHIRRLFQYAARLNPHLTILLISPNAHEIYHSKLRIHEDKDFPHGFDPDSFDSNGFDTAVYSDLRDRVICLPYVCENILGIINEKYLIPLEKGQACEEGKRLEEYPNTKIDKPTRWDDCLSYYLECEHIQKINELIDQKMSWNVLMTVNAELGGKIIVKSFLNCLTWDAGRQQWLRLYREHLPVFPENIETMISAGDNVYLKFRHPSERPMVSYELLSFYQSLLDIYEKDLIFSNPGISKTGDNHGLKLKQILGYLEKWRDNILLSNYTNLRKDKYPEEMIPLSHKITEYIETRSEVTLQDIKKTITEIEAKELGALIT